MNKFAYYVHCFAHQLQLTLVAVANNHICVASFFNLATCLINVVGGSCKCRGLLQEIQVAKLAEALNIGKMVSERGLSQEISLKRPGDTRWSSHYGTLINLIILFSFVNDCLVTYIEKDRFNISDNEKIIQRFKNIKTRQRQF
ncbi:hypothetical protein CFOL_v3_34843 [Cephalotus follicularis]|uniref:DUF4371 domain-containing protein n=1 Tax=Cephalotus follicularis TaxID=3775 RepID=A0A1Q3DGT1_CEPFO|nr:hypothetical protein CFOL_v3_34843 [Cephalotus follicularis]